MNNDQQEQPWWGWPIGIVAIGFGLIAAFFLVTEHTAHVFGLLPYLLILACPLMHLFIHHGHHGADNHAHPGNQRDDEERGPR